MGPRRIEPRSAFAVPEVVLSRAGVVASLALGVPAVGVCWLVAGTAGAWGAVAGVALVAGMNMLIAASTLFALRVFPSMILGASIASIPVRLAAYGGILAALSGVSTLDGESLTATTVTLVLAATTLQAWYSTRPDLDAPSPEPEERKPR